MRFSHTEGGLGPSSDVMCPASPVTQFFCFLPYKQQLSTPAHPSASRLHLTCPCGLDAQSLSTGLGFAFTGNITFLSLYKLV